MRPIVTENAKWMLFSNQALDFSVMITEARTDRLTLGRDDAYEIEGHYG